MENAHRVRKLLDLFARDRERIQAALPGRRGLSALSVHDVLKHRAMTTISLTAAKTGLSSPTVASAIEELQKLGIVNELTARQRNRQFLYVEYYKTLDQGAV